ncbi:MAG: efflux RND transporter permease subunit [Planctomycetes bacterium]|nr:efflux RND transporter permease subunit [Planctomycetota bacterium]
MRLSDLSIRKPVFAWMLMGALITFGWIGLRRLGVSRMPDVDFPQVSVQLTLEGASPETMETDVVDVVEDALMTVEGVRDLTSTSRQGQAQVTVEFDVGRDIDVALQEVQTKIAQAQRRLPDALDPPVVTKSNPEDQPILWVSVHGPRSPQELSDLARYRLKDRLQTVKGVGEVQMGGFLERSLRLWLDADRLDRHGVTAAEVLAAIRREHVDLPAGQLIRGGREAAVRLRGEAMDVKRFGEIVVRQDGDARVMVRDVGLVQDGLEDRRRLARFDGNPAQGLGVKKIRGANAVEVADAVKERLEELRKEVPEDVSLDVHYDTTGPVKEAVDEIGFTIAIAVVLTALVCWMFLGSWSSTFNVLLSIPTSLMGTFAVMYFCGFTLNTLSLLGLSLAVGIVVDDAIMVLENIVRHAEHGERRIRAAALGAREIGFAALAATAAIVAIFLPVAFMRGIVGRFFFEFGVTISVAVLLSLLEALTMTPARAAQILSAGGRRGVVGRVFERGMDGLARLYRVVLPGVLRWRWAVVLVGLGGFVASLSWVGGLERELTPSEDQGLVIARFQTPVGSSIESTEATVLRAEKVFRARPEVAHVFAGVGGMTGGQVNTGIFFLTLVPRGQRALSAQELSRDLRKDLGRIPDVRFSFQDPSQQGFTARRGYPVEFSIRGADFGRLAQIVGDVTARMRQNELFQDVDTDFLAGMPEVEVWPDRDRAAAMGVSMEELGRTLNVLVGGVRAGTFEDRGRRYDIRVRLLADQRGREEDVARLKVRARTGELVPLSHVVRTERRPSLQAITRQGRERAVTVFANVGGGGAQGTAIVEARRLCEELLPEGYRFTLAGSAKTMEESFTELFFALGLGIVVAYMILAAQFNSFVHPFTVLVALPFSLTGAVLALRWTGLTLNLWSFIGIVLLMGIVKKNSILLVDLTNQRRTLGAARDAALLEACPTRLRPILMTSVSTIVAALPAALASGPGGELRQPMAVAVLGGVTLSTALTLLVVPALYAVLDDLFGRRGRGVEREREAAQVLASIDLAETEARLRAGRGEPEPAGAPAHGDAAAEPRP